MSSKRYGFYQTLRVFLACPGDLVSERSRFPRLLETVNNLRAHSLGLHLEPVGWERVIPSFGRPQALINSELAKADLVVVMFWNRIGSPSSKDSDVTGTVEEFNLARKLSGFSNERDFVEGGKPLVWVYFRKSTAENGEQFEKLRQFRSALEDGKDLFFREYESIDEWEEMFRQHLVAYLDGVVRCDIERAVEKLSPNGAILMGNFLAEGIYQYGTVLRLAADLDGDGNSEEVNFKYSHGAHSLVVAKFGTGFRLPLPDDLQEILEKATVIHLAIRDVNNDGLPEILLGVNDDMLDLRVSVWGFASAALPNRILERSNYEMLGTMRGQREAFFHEGGTSVFPYGSAGLFFEYKWINGAFVRTEGEISTS